MEMGFSERVAKKALEMSNYNLEAAFEMCIGRAVIRWTCECGSLFPPAVIFSIVSPPVMFVMG